MSDFKYNFKVGVGYVGADWEEEFDLVDDCGYDEDYLEGLDEMDLERLVDEEVQEWHYQYVDYQAERI